ncbi:MAG: alanine racemase [Anaerolineae bacterium]|nr:alanine racemase [Anaerolineae bacterium]
MDIDSITRPTLLLNTTVARHNLETMAAKARRSNVRFRPHFKTHQSRQIGEWFRSEGVEAITVSSVEMAEYFAEAGWMDIFIAFSANRRELAAINRLAKRVRLGLLFEDPDTLDYFMLNLEAPVQVWFEADNGSLRTGIPIAETEKFVSLASHVKSPHILAGVMTHAGNTYHTQSTDEINRIYHQTLEGLQRLKQTLIKAGYAAVKISYGDTPALTLADDFCGLDEVRPGNFIFYDCCQVSYGVCSTEDIAVGVACPVIAVYPQRGQLVLYGGAVHLSKDRFEADGKTIFAYVCRPTAQGWGPALAGAVVSGLWQEHAMVDMPAALVETFRPGDLLVVLPAHSCLTVDLYDAYLTTDGEKVKIKQ